MAEMPDAERSPHQWEAWVNEARMRALVARMRAQQRRVPVPREDVRRAARERGEKVAQLEARFRQLRIRERGPE